MMIDLYDYAMADLYRSVGLVGFLTYVVNYACLSLRVLSSESACYFVINTLAAGMVMLSLMQDFNLASALIQGFWIAIGTVAILLRARRHLSEQRQRRRAIPLHHDAHVVMFRQPDATDQTLRRMAH